MTPAEGTLLAAAAALAGAVNSMAGGGTLLTYPALRLGAGLAPRIANATSTVAVWPGLWGAMGGYRREFAGAGRFVATLAVPSLLGGGLGAWLLLASGERVFGYVVPWLVLFATTLFLASDRIARRAGGAAVAGDPRPGPLALLYQFGVAVYGGYFGAGIGVLMLALLGALGMRDIHRMNAVKVVQGMLINAVAIGVFVVKGDLIAWPEAGLMAVAALAGGWGGSRVAKRIPRGAVRGGVVAAGFVVAGVEFWKAYGPR